jgi:endonuclease G
MQMRHITVVAALLLAACGGTGGTSAEEKTGSPFAAIGTNPQGCARFFPGGQHPQISDERYRPKARALCRRTYVVLHSGIARQPLWVAEALTREQIAMGTSVPRIDRFRPDDELPKDERAELADYRGSGYDRGHMAPDADMPTMEASQESFLLSNMSPQAPMLNRRSWAELEASVRRQTRGGRVYVVTGPLFVGNSVRTTRKGSKLLVPTGFFKAIYAQDRGATVFVATNSNNPTWMTMTVDQFRAVHGIDVFPGMKDEYRNVNGVLDGSLNRVASGTAGANAAAGGAGAASGSTTDPTSTSYIPRQAKCRRQDDREIEDPATGAAITRQDYSVKYARNPAVIERCPS